MMTIGDRNMKKEMKKPIFYIVITAVTFFIEYLCTKYITLGVMLDNSRIFGIYTPEERIKSTFYFLLPFIIIIIIQVASIIIGKRKIEDWKKRDYAIAIIVPIVVYITAFIVFVFMHQ